MGVVGITLGMLLNSRAGFGSEDHSPSSLGIQSLKAKEYKPSFTEFGEELGELGVV